MKRVPLRSSWYSMWRWLLCRAMDLFYRRMEANGVENIPFDKPVIFASNHTNALMDPLVITYFTPRHQYFMTRGDVFKQKFIGAVFRSWRMLPIFRMKDGYDTLQQNNPVMDFVIARLKEGHAIIIFAEGSHFGESTVQPLKKGLVRMAFDVINQQPESELVVVPVGLCFNDMIHVNQDILVNFGEPISVRNFPKEENEAKTFQNFNRFLRERMKELLVNIEKTEFYPIKNQLRKELEIRLKHLSLRENYNWQKKLVHQLDQLETAHPQRLLEIKSLEDYLSLPEVEADRSEWILLLRNQSSDSQLLIWLKWPLYLFALPHFLPILFLGKSLLSKVKDRTFHNSVKFGLGLLVMPVLALVQGSLLAWALGNIWVLLFYLLLFPALVLIFVDFQGRKNYNF